MWNYIKSLIPSDEEISKKELGTVINGLVTKLTPENQSELIYGLIEHREREIKKTAEYLHRIQQDKTELKNRVDILHLNDLVLNVGENLA